MNLLILLIIRNISVIIELILIIIFKSTEKKVLDEKHDRATSESTIVHIHGISKDN